MCVWGGGATYISLSLSICGDRIRLYNVINGGKSVVQNSQHWTYIKIPFLD